MTSAAGSLRRRREWAAIGLLAFAVPLLAFSSGCGRSAPGASGGGGVAAAATAGRASGANGPRFVDVASAAGLDYEWKIPGKRPLNILQTIGNGCAFLDYDADGNLDVLLVGPKLALFKGDGKGRFADVSAPSGLAALPERQYLGCAVGDADNDGFLDLYVSGYRTGLLLRNERGRAFRDITAAAGLKPQPWGTSCAFADLDGDGDLDLYVANYADFGPTTEPQLCNENGMLTSCGPRYYQPIRGVLYRNDGGRRFTDITKASGAVAATGKGLGVAVADFEGKGRPGIAIANDEVPGDLLQPVSAAGAGSIRFANVGEISGTAYDRDGNVHGGMGIDWGDYDNDGKLDLFVATFQNEAKSLYRNEGDGRFSDLALPTGLGAATTPFVAFGCKFLDYDNDGWLDLAIANGHVQDNVEKIYPTSTYRQAAQLFRNGGGAPLLFQDVSAAAGPDLRRPIVGRGLATGDFDNDGRVDLLVVDSEGKPLLLRNESGGGGAAAHWLGVKLVGTKSNRDGYGALLTARIGDRTLTRQCQAAGSYLSASDARVHFGLGGGAARVDSLTVRWPSGRTDTFTDLPADRYITLREGAPAPAPSR